MAPFIALMILLLTVVLLYYNGRLLTFSANLGFVMVVISILMFSHYFFTFGTSRFWLAVFFRHSLPVYFLLGPSLYFFVRGVLTDRPGIRLRDFWHFIPSALALIVIFPYIFKPWSYKLQVAEDIIRDYRTVTRVPFLFEYLPIVNFVLRNVSILTYIIYCLLWIQRFDRNYPGRLRIPYWDARKVLRFMRLLLGICLFGTLALIPPYYSFHTDVSITSIQFAAQPWMYIFTVILAFIPLIILFNPEVLYGIPRVSPISVPGVTIPEGLSRSGLEISGEPAEPAADTSDNEQGEGEGRFGELAERIRLFMEERKPYLDPDFTIESLAEQLGVPKHHVYYCFSSILKTRFTQMRSEYRIRYAQSLIRKGASSSQTLVAIGLESGFSSSASFRSVFKEITGMSPREYQRSLEQKVG
jgi:AraC-like DNA-binding protein